MIPAPPDLSPPDLFPPRAALPRALARRALALAALIPALWVLAACTTNPATGRAQFTAFMPEGQAKALGVQENPKILASFGGAYDDPELQAYIDEIGAEIAAVSERPDYGYSFTLLDSPIVNALALPGGYIYVTRGLLALTNTEGELAAVLGHELGHVIGRHSAERYSRGVLTQLGAGIAGAAAGSQELGQILAMGGGLALAAHSRAQEFEADDLGVRYASRAGYDSRAMAWSLQNLHRDARLQALKAGDSAYEEQFSFMQTHPLTRERVARAFDKARGKPQPGPTRRKRLLRMIEGMIYGHGPDQGMIRGREFLHPGLGFRFTAPPGFRIHNGPQAVALTERDGDALAQFTMARTGSDLSAAGHLERWVGGAGFPSPRAYRLDGRDAATSWKRGRTEAGPAVIRVFALRWEPGLFYRFVMIIPERAEAALTPAFERLTESLRPLPVDEAAAYPPWRLALIEVAPGEDIAALAAEMPMEGPREAIFRTLNGLPEGVALSPGMILKTVIEAPAPAEPGS